MLVIQGCNHQQICRTPWKLFVKHYDGASTECTLFLFFYSGDVCWFVCVSYYCLFVCRHVREKGSLCGSNRLGAAGAGTLLGSSYPMMLMFELKFPARDDVIGATDWDIIGLLL